MKHPASFRGLLALAVLAALTNLILGCQSYEPKPLDPTGSSQAWLSRSPASETVRDFTMRLAASEGQIDQPFDPADGLTLREAEPVALVFNRNLRVARLEANVKRATSDFAGLWEDPIAGVGLEKVVDSGANPWTFATTIGITIPISGRLEAEKQTASADYFAVLQKIAASEWATRATLRELWLTWSAQVTRAELAVELIGRLRDIDDLARRQYEAGVLSRIDARVFAVELASHEAKVTGEIARAKELELQIRDILGLPPGAVVNLVPSLGFAPRVSETESLSIAMADGNVELAAVRSAYAVAEESLNLEIRKQYPDLIVGPGYTNEFGDSRMVFGLALPLPLWNRNQQGVAEAVADREVARARFETTQEHLASLLAVAFTRFTAGRSVREALESRVVPLADQQDAEVRRVAELGRFDPLLVLTAINAQYSAKLQLTDAREGESIGAVRLDELIGPPLPAASRVDDASVPNAISVPSSQGVAP